MYRFLRNSRTLTISLVVTAAIVIVVLFLPVPRVGAVSVAIDELPVSTVQGQPFDFSVIIQTEAQELAPIKNIVVNIAGPDDISIVLDPQGTVLSGNEYVGTVQLINELPTGYGALNVRDPVTGEWLSFGYGYGFGGETPKVFGYRIQLLTEDLPDGDYTAQAAIIIDELEDRVFPSASSPFSLTTSDPPPPTPSPTPSAGGGTVAGDSVAPNIECKWELPDMQSGMVDREFPDPSIQYGTASNAHQHDDDMAMSPGYPCTGTPPTMPDGVKHMVQVMPNPEDSPEEVMVQLWAAVDHEQGIDAIDDVYWVIYHPDGSPKVQVHGTKIPNTPEACALLGNSTATGTMFEAAYHTGQVAGEVIDDINDGLVAKCQESAKAFYYGVFSISKHQPCGEYRIEAHAVSSGVEDVLVNYIDVLCFYYMEIDFSSVNWGTIKPGIAKIVSGDLIFNPPSDESPTIENTGNSGMGIGIRFSEMLQQGVDPIVAKQITEFDACFGRSPATIQCIDPILASGVVWFDNNRERVLCSNEVGKLDLSIHPPITLPNGAYTGTVDVYAKSVKICPTDIPPP